MKTAQIRGNKLFKRLLRERLPVEDCDDDFGSGSKYERTTLILMHDLPKSKLNNVSVEVCSQTFETEWFVGNNGPHAMVLYTEDEVVSWLKTIYQ